MHLIVDIRQRDIHDTLPSILGYQFGKLWQNYKSEDSISYLISGNDIARTENTLIADETFLPFFRKKLAQKGGNQVFRCLNFSPFTPYDPTIRTFSHITENRAFLYPSPEETNFWTRKRKEWERRSLIRESAKVLVPHLKTGQELVDIFGVSESKIEILPYFPLDVQGEIEKKNEKKYFLYDGKYGNEGNIVGLLSAWAQYRHQIGGSYELILTGFAGEELSHITHMIRMFDISESVTYTGTLTAESTLELYRNASGWIYTGAYWSGGARIELARAFGIPLLLSDLSVFSEYHSMKIHPNHLEDLAPKILELEGKEKEEYSRDREKYLRAYERVIAG